MNTDITASVKPEYPVIDRNPPFTKTVANFSTLDYIRLSTITAVSVTVGYLSGTPLVPSNFVMLRIHQIGEIFGRSCSDFSLRDFVLGKKYKTNRGAYVVISCLSVQ
jgi:NADH-ubiquinone oxidoreductase complex I, 21 kDa subunit